MPKTPVTKPSVTQHEWFETGAGADIATPADALIESGWHAPPAQIPVMEEDNYWKKRFDGLARYYIQRGLPDWDSAETYQAFDIVRGTHGGVFIAVDASTNADPEAFGSHWLPFFNGGLMGDWNDPNAGTVGDVNVTGSTVINGDYTPRNLTIGGSGSLQIVNGILRVQGTCSIGSGGKIRPDNTGTHDGLPGTSGGTGGTGNNDSTSGTIAGGGSGGTGGVGSGMGGSLGLQTQFSIGGAGGNGGSSSGGGGGGGTLTAYDPTAQSNLLQIARQNGVLYHKGGSSSIRTPTTEFLQGGSGGGGGGGGTSSNTGGGGGAGGGILIIACNHFNMAVDGGVYAPGGIGGNGQGDAGGGGGGGGGGIIILCRTSSGVTPTAANCCPGGAHGTGGSGLGAGGNGKVYVFHV